MSDYQQFGNAYGAGQLAPQGFFGGLLGAPLGGLIGRGIGGLFGNSGLGSNIGQIAGGIGGSLLPFGADPVSAAYTQQAYAQQQQQQQQQQLQQLQQQAQQAQQAQVAQQLAQQGQLAPQGWFGNLIGHVAQPLGGALGGLFGNAGLGNTIGGVAGQIGRMLPFSADPVSAAYAQQQQLQQLQQAQLAQQLGQQGQLAPQGWLGNLIGNIAQPIATTIGGHFGNAGLGSTIGGWAGQAARMLPFGADPVAAAYAQQAQQQQVQQQVQQQLQQQQQQQQIQQAQLAQQLGQQGQLAPQGWFGNLIGHVAQPLGGAIGGLFGNAGLGNTIGGVAGQIGRMLPFGADPVSAAYAQQAQLAQQQAQLNQLAQQQAQMAQIAQQQAQMGQLANGAYGGYQGGQGIVPPANVYGAQPVTLH